LRKSAPILDLNSALPVLLSKSLPHHRRNGYESNINCEIELAERGKWPVLLESVAQQVQIPAKTYNTVVTGTVSIFTHTHVEP
jgi:hypothetical protein